jgi:NADH:ubiquinone oxidoreductase subunit K
VKTLTLYIFSIGLLSFFVTPYTLLTNFVALEYLFLGVAVYGCVHGITIDDLDGQIYLLVVLAVAAAESALGLALLVQFYRLRGEVQTLSYSLVKA